MHRLHHDETGRAQRLRDLDDIARARARQMLAEALEAEVREYLDAARAERDEQGHALVVRTTVTPTSARSSWEPDRSRSRRHGSTTSEWTRMATDGASRA
jgi:hypothetical protein